MPNAAPKLDLTIGLTFAMTVALSVFLTLMGSSAFAQAAQAAQAPFAALQSAPGPKKSANDQLIERITVEDSSVKIQELRFGGETQSIEVRPKGGLPAYQVRPVTGADVQPGSGTRTWKILGF